MNEVSRLAGISRGTLYRYYASREELIRDLSREEALRFWKRCLATLQDAPAADRLGVLVADAAVRVREQPALDHMLRTDPGLVLHAIQDRFSAIRGQLEELLAPQLEAVDWVWRGLVSVPDLADWLTRLMISAYLIPTEDPDEMTRSFQALLRELTAASSRERG